MRESMKTWMLTITGRKKYWGNDQYGNSPTGSYEYDNFVQNHKSLNIDDLVLIREGERITGISVVQEISQERGVKELNECPVCGSNRVHFRKTVEPAWKCESDHSFNLPNKTIRRIVRYKASFDRDYSALVPRVPWQELRTFFVNKSALSIRKIAVGPLLKSTNETLAPLQWQINTLKAKHPGGDLFELAAKSAVADANSTLDQLREFLDGCRSLEDVSTKNSNKLKLPINQQDFDALVSEVELIETQLKSNSPHKKQVNEPSFIMERVRDFMTEYIKSAGKTAGALTVAGLAAKLVGLLDAVIIALRSILP